MSVCLSRRQSSELAKSVSVLLGGLPHFARITGHHSSVETMSGKPGPNRWAPPTQPHTCSRPPLFFPPSPHRTDVPNELHRVQQEREKIIARSSRSSRHHHAARTRLLGHVLLPAARSSTRRATLAC